MMASHAPDFGRASALPLAAVLGAIPSYPRPVIEQLVAKLIDHLDGEDGDPDFEEIETEDAFIAHRWENGAGCPASDPNEDDTEDCGIEDLPHDDDDPAEDTGDAEMSLQAASLN